MIDGKLRKLLAKRPVTMLSVLIISLRKNFSDPFCSWIELIYRDKRMVFVHTSEDDFGKKTRLPIRCHAR